MSYRSQMMSYSIKDSNMRALSRVNNINSSELSNQMKQNTAAIAGGMRDIANYNQALVESMDQQSRNMGMQLDGINATLMDMRDVLDKILEATYTADKVKAAKFSLSQGVKFFNGGHYDEAMAEFDEVLRVFRDNFMAYSMKGQILASRDDYDAALFNFQKALTFGYSYISDESVDQEKLVSFLFTLSLKTIDTAFNVGKLEVVKDVLQSLSSNFETGNNDEVSIHIGYLKSRYYAAGGNAGASMRELRVVVENNPFYLLQAATDNEFENVRSSIADLTEDLSKEQREILDRYKQKTKKFLRKLSVLNKMLALSCFDYLNESQRKNIYLRATTQNTNWSAIVSIADIKDYLNQIEKTSVRSWSYLMLREINLVFQALEMRLTAELEHLKTEKEAKIKYEEEELMFNECGVEAKRKNIDTIRKKEKGKNIATLFSVIFISLTIFSVISFFVLWGQLIHTIFGGYNNYLHFLERTWHFPHWTIIVFLYIPVGFVISIFLSITFLEAREDSSSAFEEAKRDKETLTKAENDITEQKVKLEELRKDYDAFLEVAQE